jgi:hypothetical protein
MFDFGLQAHITIKNAPHSEGVFVALQIHLLKILFLDLYIKGCKAIVFLCTRVKTILKLCDHF